MKVRLAPALARQAGWTDASQAIPALVIGDSRAARRIVEAHAALLGGFPMRGRRATAWLREPRLPAPLGVIWFAMPANGHAKRFTEGQRARKRPNSRQTKFGRFPTPSA